MEKTMQAYVLRGDAAAPTGNVESDFLTETLPEGELLIKVLCSGLNYKDAMVAVGQGRMVRNFPHIPGVDLAGEVEADTSGRFKQGDQVLVTGYHLGVGSFGGFAQYARVPAKWALPLPVGFTCEQAMILGTAGLTAMLAIHALERNGLKTNQGPVVVTGASGGVGSISVNILAQLGYEVHAVSGKRELTDWLKELGASEVIPRSAVEDDSGKPLLKERWAGGIDNAGGKVLEGLIRTTKRECSVAAIGLVAGHAVETTVYPFILRGINLLGIDSVFCPASLRQRMWERLAGDEKPRALMRIVKSISFAELPQALQCIIQGQAKGRFVLHLPVG